MKPHRFSNGQVNLIARRPKKSPKTGKLMPVVRGISNEAELQAALDSIEGIAVRSIDLSSIDLTSQLDLIFNTDILIGTQTVCTRFDALISTQTLCTGFDAASQCQHYKSHFFAFAHNLLSSIKASL